MSWEGPIRSRGYLRRLAIRELGCDQALRAGRRRSMIPLTRSGVMPWWYSRAKGWSEGSRRKWGRVPGGWMWAYILRLSVSG